MKNQEYKLRKDVPVKYTWDIESILKGKTADEWIKEWQKKHAEAVALKPTAFTSKKDFLKWCKLEAEIYEIIYKIFNYGYLRGATDTVNPEYNAYQQNFQTLMVMADQKMGPVEPEIFKNANNIKKWIELPEFTPYKRAYTKTLEEKSRQLPRVIQEYRQKVAAGTPDFSKVASIIQNSEVEFDDIIASNGKRIKLTEGNRAALSQHKDPKVRKQAILNHAKGYLKHKQSLSNLLYQHLKRQSVEAKLRKFDSTVAASIHGDRFPEESLMALYDAVKGNTHILDKFNKNFAKFYKAKYKISFTEFDGRMKLVDSQSEYSVDEAIKITKEVVKPFGKEYQDMIKRAFDERWIDFYPHKNKQMGAFSMGGSYGNDKKFINMNFNGTYGAVSTLCHELGHSMHSYYSDSNNGLHEAGYPIFLAEIASIFNELLLTDYMMNKDGVDDKTKFAILTDSIKVFFSTINSQTQWSNYEYNLMKKIDANEPVSTFEALQKVYKENEKDYAANKAKYKDKEHTSIWAFIVPHYYANFYVYKYAIGYICANIFFQKYKEEGKEALDKYINGFLKTGDRDWPLQILKNAGIDLTDKSTFNLAYNKVNADIDEWIKLGKKIFKMK